MATLLSPGIQVTEKDLTNIIPAVSSSAGAFAGDFSWGPVLSPTTVESENVLRKVFGKPTNSTAESFFTAANFLAYTNKLIVARTDATGNRNAVAQLTGSISAITIGGGGTQYSTAPTVVISAPQAAGGIQAVATATVSDGNVTSVTITNAGTGYASAEITFEGGTIGSVATATATITTGSIKINNLEDYEVSYEGAQGTVGPWAARYPGTLGNSIKVSICDSSTWATWAYKAEFDGAPDVNEVHIIVRNKDTSATLEKYKYLSKKANGRSDNGKNIYYRDVIKEKSNWIYWMDHPTGTTNWGLDDDTLTPSLLSALSAPNVAQLDVALIGGANGTATDADKIAGFRLFADATKYDISLIPLGKASTAVVTDVISNVAETRKDCLVFASASTSTGAVIRGTSAATADLLVAYRNALTSSSYVVLDSGYKYQYDRYNDVYRWIPLNGDTAGVCARTDLTDDPWFSPAGFTRGQIKNVTKLAYNPEQVGRDTLYKAGINPVASFPGQGTILYGDKTMLAKPSAFDRINVRRLFIVLEKAISEAAKFQLFELNDQFTRAQFRSMIEPYLREVQGRRGIYDFRVICDETNNTGEIIDSNRFVADIYIKPARAINFISLNFIAARTSVSFEEIGL